MSGCPGVALTVGLDISLIVDEDQLNNAANTRRTARRVYAGSPMIAAVQNRLADALEAVDSGSGWTNWRRPDNHVAHVEAMRKSLVAPGSKWQRLTDVQRENLVRAMFAPPPRLGRPCS